MDDLRKFARYFRPYKKSLAVGILCILLSVAFGLLVPLYVGRAVDDLRADVTWRKITGYALIILGVSLVSGVFLFLQRRVLIGMSRHVEYDLRQDFFAHLQKLPASFFHENRTGDLMARATNDLAAVRQLAGPLVFTLADILSSHRPALDAAHRVRLTLLLFVTMRSSP